MDSLVLVGFHDFMKQRAREHALQFFIPFFEEIIVQ